MGKSSAAGGMNTLVQGVQVTTTSKKFYKYVNESTNSNLYHFCNDSFASPSGINWDRLLQSINSISHGVGRHFIVVEGHRLFECDTLLDDADYIVTLTALPSTLRCRPEPTAEESLQLYISRVKSHLQALNDSKGIMKINGISSPEIVIKKIGAFIALKNKGLQHCGLKGFQTQKHSSKPLWYQTNFQCQYDQAAQCLDRFEPEPVTKYTLLRGSQFFFLGGEMCHC